METSANPKGTVDRDDADRWIVTMCEAAVALHARGVAFTMQAVTRAMADKLAQPVGLVQAWVESTRGLATIAAAPMLAEETALDEERRCVQEAMRAGRPILEWRLQERLNRADESGSACVCEICHRPAASQGLRVRHWQSVTGDLPMARRYMSCPHGCGWGEAPAERTVGLPQRSAHTAYFEDRCTRMATLMPYRKAVVELEQWMGRTVGITTVQRMTERRADAVRPLQEAEAKNVAPYDAKGLPREWTRPANAVPSAPDVAYVETDGVIALTRELRAATQATPESLPDGGEAIEHNPREQRAAASDAATTRSASANGRGGKGRKYEIVGREIKNAVLYDSAHCAPESDTRGCITEKHYVSHLGGWKSFALLLWAQLVRLRFDQARLLVILSDGAEWVRSLGEWLPITVLLILDLFHVKHRIWEVAHAIFGQDNSDGAAWARVQCERIEAGRAPDVIDALRFLRPPNASTRELRDALDGYLRNNLDRMDYPHYRSLGLRVTTSAVESGNFHMTGDRIKRQGMRWIEHGASHMATLRADYANDDWDRRTNELLAAA